MFVVSQKDTRVWPVEVEQAVDGGRFERATFDAEFAVLPQSQINAMIDSAGRLELNDIGFSMAVLRGWRGIQDEAGDPVPFSIGARDRMLEIPGFARAVVSAYMAMLAGGQRKN